MRELGALESAVMEQLWAADEPVSVRAVVELLHERQLAYTTVATVLDKLHRKGWVERERVGRVWQYRPKVGSSEHAAHLMREALTGSASPRATFLRFVDEITEDEAALLRELLEQGPAPER